MKKAAAPLPGMVRRSFLAGVSSIRPDAQPDSRVVRFIVSTEDVDRQADIIKMTGWELDTFRKCPTITWAHDYSQPPIGRANRIEVQGESLVADIEFMPKALNPFADSIYEMVKAGYINGASVGFQPIDADYDARRKGYTYKRQNLLEIAIVPIPANPEALAQRRAGDATADARETLRAWATKALTLADAPAQKAIHHRDGKWVVTDASGDEVLGEHETQAEAMAQLHAIEAAKHRREGKAVDGDDVAVPRAVIAALCPSCGEAMAAKGWTHLKLSTLKAALAAGTVTKAGFSQGLCDRFGADEGFFTRCDEAMAGAEGVDDPKAFCAALHEYCTGHWPGEAKDKAAAPAEQKAMAAGDPAAPVGACPRGEACAKPEDGACEAADCPMTARVAAVGPNALVVRDALVAAAREDGFVPAYVTLSGDAWTPATATSWATSQGWTSTTVSGTDAVTVTLGLQPTSDFLALRSVPVADGVTLVGGPVKSADPGEPVDATLTAVLKDVLPEDAVPAAAAQLVAVWKRGRVLAARNEARLRQAAALLQAALDELRREGEDGADEKAAAAVVAKAPKPPGDDDEDEEEGDEAAAVEVAEADEPADDEAALVLDEPTDEPDEPVLAVEDEDEADEDEDDERDRAAIKAAVEAALKEQIAEGWRQAVLATTGRLT